MKKLFPWIGGALVGILFTGMVVGVLALLSALRPGPDPAYELVAVSWGTPANNSDLWLYQVQVIADDSDKDGIFDVRAKGCIGSSSYFHDFGALGTAADRGEAVRNFGDITWEADRVTIGGEEGIKGSVMRKQLERHR